MKVIGSIVDSSSVNHVVQKITMTNNENNQLIDLVDD